MFSMLNMLYISLLNSFIPLNYQCFTVTKWNGALKLVVRQIAHYFCTKKYNIKSINRKCAFSPVCLFVFLTMIRNHLNALATANVATWYHCKLYVVFLPSFVVR